MIDWQTIIKSFQSLLAQVCLSALFAIVGACTVMKFIGLSRSSLSRLWRKSRMGLAAMALLSLVMESCGDIPRKGLRYSLQNAE